MSVCKRGKQAQRRNPTCPGSPCQRGLRPGPRCPRRCLAPLPCQLSNPRGPPAPQPPACSSGLYGAGFLGDSSVCCHGNGLVISTLSPAGRPGQKDGGQSKDEGLGEEVASGRGDRLSVTRTASRGRRCRRPSGARSLPPARQEWGARSGASALTWGVAGVWDSRVMMALSDFIEGPGNAPNSPDDNSTHLPPPPPPPRPGARAGWESRGRLPSARHFVTRAGLCSRTSGDRRLGREPMW